MVVVVADPATLLGDLPKRYTLAARFSVSDLPKEYRDQFLAQIRAGAEVGINQLPSGNGDDAEVKATVASDRLENINDIFARMHAGQIEGRIVLDLAA